MLDDGTDPWWRNGVCAEIGPDLFFLNMGEPGTEAKRACRMCPVRVQCLADSADRAIEFGIFGGFGRDERRKLADRIEAGEHPIDVAIDAIETEERELRRGKRRTADHPHLVPPRRRRDRLRPRTA